jgi:hypothetical protein
MSDSKCRVCNKQPATLTPLGLNKYINMCKTCESLYFLGLATISYDKEGKMFWNHGMLPSLEI